VPGRSDLRSHSLTRPSAEEMTINSCGAWLSRPGAAIRCRRPVSVWSRRSRGSNPFAEAAAPTTDYAAAPAALQGRRNGLLYHGRTQFHWRWDIAALLALRNRTTHRSPCERAPVSTTSRRWTGAMRNHAPPTRQDSASYWRSNSWVNCLVSMRILATCPGAACLMKSLRFHHIILVW
jgi:hypothetical protein